MICEKCGGNIPKGQQSCPRCGGSAKAYNHGIKSVKPRIDKDMLECPICSLKGIAPKEKMCPKCKIKFIEAPWMCNSCRVQNQYPTVKCVHCGKGRNSSGKSEQAQSRKGMAFYHYLIYFGLFASAVLSFYSGCMTMSENGLLGFYYLLYGVFALVARFLLAGRKRAGLRLYIGMLCADSLVTLLSISYLQDMISSGVSKAIDTYGAYASQAALNEVGAVGSAAKLGVLIGSFVVYGIDAAIFKYFTNRKDYFDQ